MHKAKTSRVSLNKLSDHGLKSVVSPVLFYCKSKFRFGRKKEVKFQQTTLSELYRRLTCAGGVRVLKFV